MTTDPWVVRPLSAADLPEVMQLDDAAFHIDAPADYVTDVVLPILAGSRLTGVHDPAAGDRLVGTAAILPKRMTLPGGRVAPVAAVTMVAVRAGWRRRGLLSALMREQLHGLHDRADAPDAEALAILTASEGVIYGRYGYGRAVDGAEIRLPHGAAFAAGVRTEPVREIDPDGAAALARGLWGRVAPRTTGHLTRTDADWNGRFSSHPFLRRGMSDRRWAAHDDAVVGYRVRPGWRDRDGSTTVRVTDLVAASPVAHASLWRFLLDLDLTDRVEFPLGWADDPVQDLLADRRQLTLTPQDHVWLRIVDLDRAIGQRGYAMPVTVDVEFVDELCPWNAGAWRLELDPAGGRAVRSAGEPQIRMHIRDLAAGFVGGTRLSRLAAAGLVTGEPDAIRDLDAALSAPLAPWCPEGF